MVQLLFIIVCLLSFPVLGSGSYTLPDLEVLAREGSHEEFLAHALDVRPSERGDVWKGMVSTMAAAQTKAILQKSEITREDFLKVQALWKWPSLKTDDIFKSRRQDISVTYLKRCLKSENPCWKELGEFWESDHSDPETAFKLAELISQFKNSPYTLWTFLDVALKSNLSEFYCKKEFTLDSLWGKLEVDYIRLGPKGDLLKKIDETVHPDCLPSLNKTAQTRLISPKKNGDRELAYQILAAQSKAGEDLSDFFYTVYLLEGPSQGELFNYSWNRVKELGSSPARRDAVLIKLKTLDPLPDEILGSFDLTKKRVILTHFKRHFPEYLDHYVGQCVKFYGGKDNFPHGNPTIHCQDLMKSEIAPQILDQFQIKQYQDVRKI